MEENYKGVGAEEGLAASSLQQRQAEPHIALVSGRMTATKQHSPVLYIITLVIQQTAFPFLLLYCAQDVAFSEDNQQNNWKLFWVSFYPNVQKAN